VQGDSLRPLDNQPDGSLLEDGRESSIHMHHWLIAKQDGPESEGVCKWCGSRRSFSNGFTGSYAGYPRRIARSR